MTMILHCGGKTVSLDEARAVPLPQATRSYKPVGHGTVIDMVEAGIGHFIPSAKVADRQVGLGRDGQHLFALWTLETQNTLMRREQEGEDSLAFSIAVRNSYDKSLAVGIAAGAKVFVCDNLCFSGSDFHVARKHTTNVMRDLRGLVAKAMQAGPRGYAAMQRLRIALKGVDLTTDDGYKLLGLMQGKGVIRPQQATIAFREWGVKPSHEEFAPRTAWSFYNCLTEATKKGQAGDVITRHAGLTAFCQQTFVPA